jgi:hypothetical protein
VPLSVNVGISRKASRDYQSTGVSINVTAELDQALLAKPEDLQKQIGDLYFQAESALDRQVKHLGTPAQSRNGGDGRNGGYSNGGRRNGNGAGNGNRGDAQATESQRRAINSIADRLGIDPALECRDMIRAELEHLSIRQASELIDHLKAIQPTGNGNRR